MNDLKLPNRPKEGHKGTFGTLAVFGGHTTGDSVMLGSAYFVARSAIKAGVGLVEFVSDKDTLKELIKMLPQAIGHTYSDFNKHSDKWTTVVIGPGLSGDSADLDILRKVLKLKLPTVIDGEGLNLISRNPDLLSLIHSHCVLTPHPKEFERLASASNEFSPDKFAERYKCTLVLKDAKTNIYRGADHWEKEVNNPVLATGGTGDVLAGYIGGLIAQKNSGLDVYESAKLAVEINSKAADEYKSKHSDRGLEIDQLIDLLN